MREARFFAVIALALLLSGCLLYGYAWFTAWREGRVPWAPELRGSNHGAWSSQPHLEAMNSWSRGLPLLAVVFAVFSLMHSRRRLARAVLACALLFALGVNWASLTLFD